MIGIKVWVYKGEIIPKGETALLPEAAPAPAQPETPAEPTRAKKPFPKTGAKRAPAKPRAPTRRTDKPAVVPVVAPPPTEPYKVESLKGGKRSEETVKPVKPVEKPSEVIKASGGGL